MSVRSARLHCTTVFLGAAKLDHRTSTAIFRADRIQQCMHTVRNLRDVSQLLQRDGGLAKLSRFCGLQQFCDPDSVYQLLEPGRERKGKEKYRYQSTRYSGYGPVLEIYKLTSQCCVLEFRQDTN